ncbi:hypothetical protein PPD89_001241 [Citrobacter farmeri]|nr:hypothetical protein [Citrobacter farmeri]
MKFTDALILAVILVGGYHYFFDKDELTGNEKLISQFDKMGVLKKTDWKKGAVVGGIQGYTATTEDTVVSTVWALGADTVTAMVISSGKDIDGESLAAVNQCVKLVEGVTGKKDPETSLNQIAEIFTKATTNRREDDSYSASGFASGMELRATIRKIMESVTYSCDLRKA